VFDMTSLTSLQAKIGTEIGVSDWLMIDQPLIDRFADLTGDHQFIHVDPVAAARTPFGGTIAHGFLILSMLAKLVSVSDIRLDGATMGVNYGFDRVRLISPVLAGRRIRGRFLLKHLTPRAPGQWLATLAATVEIEGEEKPALLADWLTLQFVTVEGTP
jgi:acyl dehydratase